VVAFAPKVIKCDTLERMNKTTIKVAQLSARNRADTASTAGKRNRCIGRCCQQRGSPTHPGVSFRLNKTGPCSASLQACPNQNGDFEREAEKSGVKLGKKNIMFMFVRACVRACGRESEERTHITHGVERACVCVVCVRGDREQRAREERAREERQRQQREQERARRALEAGQRRREERERCETEQRAHVSVRTCYGSLIHIHRIAMCTQGVKYSNICRCRK